MTAFFKHSRVLSENNDKLFREATPQELHRIENQKETTANAQSWRSGPENETALCTAFRRRDSIVTLNNVRYTITYTAPGNKQRAYVKAERNYSPAGWFDIAQYLRDKDHR